MGNFSYSHGILFYEKINSSIVENSKDRRVTLKKSNFIKKQTEEENFFVPVILNLITKCEYIDVFKDILHVLYSIINESTRNQDGKVRDMASSLEFLKIIMFLYHESVVPNFYIQIVLKIGEFTIKTPVELSHSLPSAESCILTLFDLIEITHIIQIWEVSIFGFHLFFFGSDDYLIYLIISAFKKLVFPLKWEYPVIPILSVHDIDKIHSISPVMIGINKNKHKKEKLMKKIKDDTVLDIDTDQIFTGFESCICECIKEKMHCKLRLAKIFFYSEKNRYKNYNLEELIYKINDPQFLQEINWMSEMEKQCEKEEKFLKIVRTVFFDLFRHLSPLDNFMKQNPDNMSFIISTAETVKATPLCKGPECKMPMFWNSIMDDSQNFYQYLGHYKKFDQGNLRRSEEIISCENAKNVPEVFSCEIKQNKETLKFLHELMDFNSSFIAETEVQKFKQRSFTIHFENIKNYLENESFYDSSSQFLVNKSISQFFTGTVHEHNSFYGEFGVIRLMSLINQSLVLSSIKKASKNLFNTHQCLKQSWQGLLINFFYHCKNSYSDWNVAEMLEIAVQINEINPDALPNHYLSILIDKIFAWSPENFDNLFDLGGKIKVFARNYKNCIERPNSIYRLNKSFSEKRSRNLKLLNPYQYSII